MMNAAKTLATIYVWTMLMLLIWAMLSIAHDFTQPVNVFSNSENLRYYLVGIFGYMFFGVAGLGATALGIDLIIDIWRKG